MQRSSNFSNKIRMISRNSKKMPMMLTPLKELLPNSGGKIGRMKISMMISEISYKNSCSLDLCVHSIILIILISMSHRVSYFYHEDIGNFYYYKDHPMKPRRIAMAHSLIESFDLYKKLDVYENRRATSQDLLKFHHHQYVEYLENFVSKDVLTCQGFAYTNDISMKYEEQRKSLIMNSKRKSQFSMTESGDCPGFTGLYQFSQLSCGGSIDAAYVLLRGDSDIAINWGGGLHHAKKCEASGFCYMNDIVLGILELLKYHKRVLYLDVDVHHGDGVEQAFYLTDRVMTVSFHQYGDGFFPGTGGVDSVGQGKGKYYSVNVPLKQGIDDDSYRELFDTVMDEIMSKYRPESVVLQLGADSIAYDILGKFNMTIKGHGHCVTKMMSYGVPLMLLGGGGYTIHNVARCWLYETGLVLGQEIQGSIPKTDRFYQAYLPDSRIHFNVKPVKNKNSPEYLQEIKEKIFNNLKNIESSPGVPFHNIPTMAFENEKKDEEMEEEVQNGHNNGKYLSNLLSRRGMDEE